jgi:hypothetical protein
MQKGAAMGDPAERERHNVNLSRQIWGELKLRSFQEGMSASEMVAYVVERYLNESYLAFHLPRYQPRNTDEDRLGRTVFFTTAAWRGAQNFAQKNSISISALIDFLLRRYLGLLADEEAAPPETEAQNTVRIGEERVYLGENPLRIDLKTGKTKTE